MTGFESTQRTEVRQSVRREISDNRKLQRKRPQDAKSVNQKRVINRKGEDIH